MNNPVDKTSELSRLISARLEDISFNKNQREVADEAGFVNRNMLSLIKNGQTKLSLDRVPAMARALGLPVEAVLLPALRQYYTEEVIGMMREVFGVSETLTEHQILAIARQNMNTSLSLSHDARVTLAEVFKAI